MADIIEVSRVQFRRDELVNQLQQVGIQIAKTAQQLEALKTKEVATKGAIAGLDEILNADASYGQPPSVVDKHVPPQEKVNSV